MAPLTFADTHIMIAFLNKSDASEGFDQIVDFLNAHTIHYALMVNPAIYVSCIKQFWASVSIKNSNDVVKLQALIDKKKVIITKDTIRQNLRLDDADGIDCLPNEEIFSEVESSNDTVVDDQEDASKRGGIDELNADEDVTLVDVDAGVEMDANIQGRMAESHDKAYNLDLQYFEKVLSMQDTDEVEPAEVEEVLKVVTAAKRRMGVIIEDPEETATTLVIMHSKIDTDEAFARQLEAELNANISWNEVIKQVKRKERQDNEVMRYQALNRKPLTKAQARKNMMIYLKNMAGFKMDFLKGMTYSEIRPLFEKHYNFFKSSFSRESKGREPKNFSDDFLLNTLKIMFEKPNVKANMFMLVEKKYPLTHFTLEQMLNNVRLEVEEESEMSLELLRQTKLTPLFINIQSHVGNPQSPPFIDKQDENSRAKIIRLREHSRLKLTLILDLLTQQAHPLSSLTEVTQEDKIKESKLLIDELDPPRLSDFLPSPEYDSVLYEDFSEVDALPSTINEDKVFNPGILIHENLFEITVRVAPDKNVKKISSSNASLILEDFNPPLSDHELPFHKEVPKSETLLSFSSKNKEKVSNPRILTSKGVHTSLLLELSHQGPKAFKVIKNFVSPMEIFPCSYREDIRILDVLCLHFYPHEQLNSVIGSS
uniref:Xylulose kinase-1 n=1 Tax=Tanacetum cinerariifolium TaxID=118510 RepID=A0A6L2LI81_TANCI|nr:hypothetical protein [Tanacetum cinerariifolium]